MPMDVQGLAALLPTEAPPSTTNREAAQQFEAYMVTFLAQQMRASSPEGPMSSGPMSTFAGLFDQEIGKRVAERGGLGLEAQLERALSHAGLPARPTRPTHHTGDVEPVSARITSGFGTRSDPFTHEARVHSGTDYGMAEGTPVRAVEAGTVSFAGKRGGYGNVVILTHADGTETRYAHCSALSVATGDTVDAGAQLGNVGHTGRATGPHLHFEVRVDGKAVDPEGWLRGR